MNLQRLYEYRFREVDSRAKEAVWSEIARFLYRRLGEPQKILEPGGGRGEFLRALPAVERWAVDIADHGIAADSGIRFVRADVFEADLPRDYFDAIFVSNFLEHLPNPDAVAAFLAKMRQCLRPGGRLAVMGPNFRYCAREYFDCADHALILTHIAVAEHLYASGFSLDSVVGKFLPFSFRSRLPASRLATRLYLRVPVLWSVFGKQFLVCGRKDSASGATR
jgi:SAM-dependent methyltransferase